MLSFTGAIDSSVVTNASLINWNNVAQFSPFGAESNVSSYLQWAIAISSFGVGALFVSMACAHLFVGKWNSDYAHTNLR